MPGLRSPAFRLFAGLLFVMALVSLTLRLQPSLGQNSRIKQESPQDLYQKQRLEQQLRELQQQRQQEQQEKQNQRKQREQDQQNQPEQRPVPTGSFQVCVCVCGQYECLLLCSCLYLLRTVSSSQKRSSTKNKLMKRALVKGCAVWLIVIVKRHRCDRIKPHIINDNSQPPPLCLLMTIMHNWPLTTDRIAIDIVIN